MADLLNMQPLPQNTLQEIYNLKPPKDSYPSYGNFGLPHTEESKRLIGIASRESQKNGGHRLGMQSPFKDQNHTKEIKQKIAMSLSGRTLSAAHRGKMSESALNRKRVECPRCGTNVPVNVAKRWHFDNCKSIDKLDN